MKCIEKFEYNVYKVAIRDYGIMLDELLSCIDTSNKILRLVLFVDVKDNEDYNYKFSIFKNKALKIFREMLPVITLVPQKPLDSGLTLEVHSYNTDIDDNIEYNSYNGFSYVVVNNCYGRFLFAGGLQSDVHKDIYHQAIDIFDIIDNILKKENFSINSIVRQWNYIENITTFDKNGNQHYQMFNNARSLFYSKEEWSKGYPAATGIGTSAGGVIIDFDAVKSEKNSISIIPIDNKLQIAAHLYSKVVLGEDVNGKTTPKFERAKSIDIDGSRMVYISGTAAIRGEESLYGVSIENQLGVTIENIRQLIGDSKVRLLRVYLKNEEYYEKVRVEFDNRNDFHTIYLLSDICRNELLIEIEGIAFDV